jgi:hypothetical protein
MEQCSDRELNLPVGKLLPAFDDPRVSRCPRLVDDLPRLLARGFYGAHENLDDGGALWLFWM